MNTAPSSMSATPTGELSVAAARAAMLQDLAPVRETQDLGLIDALGRVLGEDIVSPIDVPAHDNAAMDGWALRGTDLVAGRACTLREIGTALAGQPWAGEIRAGECLRIMTGAVMPAGCDTVVPQELARGHGQQISIAADAVRPGEHRRRRGEDLARGSVALAAGRILRPADLGLLASLGMDRVTVRRRLRVAVFSTGDELHAPGQPLPAGGVYDSNRYTLLAMLARLGCEAVDLGRVPDEPALLEAAYRRGCEAADTVMTSGGVSVGEADFTKQIMARLGEVRFWRIAMRPGRPMAFGRIASGERQASLFGLPGNPVAVMVTFYFLVRPALLRMMGAEESGPPEMTAMAAETLRKKPGRTEFQRGILERDASGQLMVRRTGAQGSGILSSMSAANCMIVLAHEQGNVATGETVAVLPFDGLV